jgi:hypothetical protein
MSFMELEGAIVNINLHERSIVSLRSYVVLRTLSHESKVAPHNVQSWLQGTEELIKEG